MSFILKMNNPELKPCPFCGDAQIIQQSTSAWGEKFLNNKFTKFKVVCRCPIYFDNIDEAVMLWNKRYEQ